MAIWAHGYGNEFTLPSAILITFFQVINNVTAAKVKKNKEASIWADGRKNGIEWATNAVRASGHKEDSI